MRRSTLIAALALPAALAVAAAMPALFPSGRLVQALENRLCKPRGVTCQIASAHLSLLPLPQITAQDVTASLDGRPGVRRAQSVTARLALWPLLKGQLAFSSLTLEDADLAIDTKGLHGPDGTAIMLIEALSTQAKRWTDFPVHRVALNRSRLIDLQGREWADQLLLELGLPGQNDAMALNGSARWRGETVRVTARLAQPRDLANGGRSEILIGLTAPLLAVSLEGVANGGALAQVNGQFTASSANPAAMAAWFGEGEALWPSAPFATAGSARFARELVALTMNKFTIGKTQLEGNVAFRRDAKGLQLTGTLAADTLDLPLPQGTFGPRFMQEDQNEWSLFSQERPIAVDLRLSATSAKIGRIAVSNLGMALMVRDRKADLVLAGADYAGGTMKGRMSISDADGRLDLKLQGHLDAVDLARALAPFGAKRMNGTVHAHMQLETRGSSDLELWRGLDGRASLTIKQGDLVGINVPEILRRIEKRPLLTALDLRGGRTPFEQAQASLRIAQGVATISEASLVSPATLIELSGSLYLPERIIALKGLAAPNRPEGAALPFEIKGSFDEPALIPDARALIRRSGAAAPFFKPSAAQPNN